MIGQFQAFCQRSECIRSVPPYSNQERMNVRSNRIEVSKDEDKPAQRMTDKGFWGKEILLIIALVMIYLTLFFFRLGARPLWDIDEGMHAATSKTMVLSGDWVTAQYNFFYVLLSFAVLSKGPLGVVLPAMVVGLFLVLKRKLSFLKEMQIGWGILIFIVAASPWYILISIRNPDYAGYFLIDKSIGSFFSDDVRHLEPFYYYVPVLLGGFFPVEFILNSYTTFIKTDLAFRHSTDSFCFYQAPDSRPT